MRQWFLTGVLNAMVVAGMAAGLWAGVYDSQSVRNKLDMIEGGRTLRGARIAFSAAELNAWVAGQTLIHAPQGVRNPRLTFGIGLIIGYADVDFLKVRHASTGESPGWLLKNLFAGERPVKVTARLQSRAGRGRVDLERVEISGVAIEGRALDFAIDAFVRPAFPYAKVSEWFDLQFGVDHFTVSPSGVTVLMARK